MTRRAARRRSASPVPDATWDNRPALLFGEHGRIDIHARLQTDYLVRNEADPDAAALPFEDRLSVARKRVGVSGELFDRISFQVEGELSDAQPWRDVYADVKSPARCGCAPATSRCRSASSSSPAPRISISWRAPPRSPTLRRRATWA